MLYEGSSLRVRDILGVNLRTMVEQMRPMAQNFGGHLRVCLARGDGPLPRQLY